MRIKTCIVILLVFLQSFSFAQVQTFYVEPIETDLNYAPSQDSSAVSRNNTFQLNKLFLFIGGTNSSSSTDYNALRLHAANLGYDFINLSYPNNVAAASLENSLDNLAFDKYRQEVCFGTPVSVDVTVDTLNSIYTRTLKLIQYLDLTYPSQNWEEYLLTPTTLDWSKIIVGGHSQGSGHACYLAKEYLIERVLMFAGPNDYSTTFSTSANWLNVTGITPVYKHFVYLSLNDEAVDFSKQFVNITGLGMLTSDDTTFVDNIPSPYGNSHCLYTTQAPGLVILNHNVPIKLSAINNDVWTYMLTTDVTAGIENNYSANEILVFPNPASNSIFLSSDILNNETNYSVHQLSGELIKDGALIQQDENYMIDISELKMGIYILKVNDASIRIIKQ